MKRKYIQPEISKIGVPELMQSVTGNLPSGSKGHGSGAGWTDAKGWFGNFGEDPSAPTPVGGTATQGEGKSALELPTQNRRIWGD